MVPEHRGSGRCTDGGEQTLSFWRRRCSEREGLLWRFMSALLQAILDCLVIREARQKACVFLRLPVY